MTPGDVLTCAACGTSAVAYSTQPAAWQPGGPLVVSWHGHRHEALSGPAPDLCLPCRVAEFPRPPATRREWICNELARNGCCLVGAEWNTDDRLEEALQRWIAGGSPPLALVEVSPERGGRARVGPRDADIPVDLLALPLPKREGDAVYLKPAQGSLF